MRRAPIVYSADEMKWLEDNRAMVIGDYHAAFVDRFRRTDVSAAHLHGLRKRKGWKVGRAAGRYVGRSTLFSKAELVWLEANCTLPISDYLAGFLVQFGRSEIHAQQLHALRKRRGWKTGRTGQFEKGAAPWSKGKKMPFHPNSAATRFKKGQLPHNTKFAGHERINCEGYVEISIEETNPHTGFERRYVHKHRWLWEQQNGPIPDGMCLKCLGEKSDPHPSNWELVPRAVLPRLNGIHGRGFDAAPDEIKPTILAVTKLEHELRERRQAR